MAETTLGIDFEDGTVRLVLAACSLKGAQLLEAAEAKLPADADMHLVAETVRDLIDRRSLRADRYAVGMAGAKAHLRHMSFPFTSEGKILQVLDYELESTLPVEMDSVSIDFLKTSQRTEGGQGILAAALPKDSINPVLDAFLEAGIDPDVLDLDVAALEGLAWELRDRLPERTVFLDLGWSRTSFLYQVKDRPAAMRSMGLGVRDLAKAAAGPLGVTVEEARQRLGLMDLSPRSFAGPPEEERALEACRQMLDRIAKEVRMSILSALGGADGPGEELLALCGEGAGLRGMATVLGGKLGIEVRRLGDLEGAQVFASLSQKTPIAPYATAAGLALRAMDRAQGFNFRSGEFSSHKSLIQLKTRLFQVGAAALAVFLAWLCASLLDLHVKEAELATLDDAVSATFRSIAPDIRGASQSAQYIGLLKGRINEINNAMSFLSGDLDQPLSVDVLKGLSAALPKSLDISVNQFTLDGKVVRLGGVADSFNTVEEAKNRLNATPQFSDVKIVSANAGNGGKGIQFTMEMTRKKTGAQGG